MDRRICGTAANYPLFAWANLNLARAPANLPSEAGRQAISHNATHQERALWVLKLDIFICYLFVTSK